MRGHRGGCSNRSSSTHGQLGAWADRLRRPPVLGLPITLQEATVEWRPSYFPDRFDAAEVQRRVADHRVACGQALVAALLHACLSRGIEPRVETRAQEITLDGRRVSGLVVDQGGRRFDLPATSVVLASGGFEWNGQLRERFLPGPLTHPHSPPANEGDGLLMAMEVGADLANMTETWWYPASSVPGEHLRGPTAGPVPRHRADRPPLGHRRPVRPAVRQRGRQLQRHAKGLLPLRRQRVHHPAPPLLGGVRPPVPFALPRRQRPARRSRPRVAGGG